MDIRIRKGEVKDLPAYLQLLRQVKQRMTQSDWFYLDPEEEVYERMESGQLELWVAEDGNWIAGAFSIVHPGLESFNLGNDLGFEEEALQRVVHMDTAAVDPDYRGRKLQYRLMAYAEEELSARGRKILLCTVHPENRYSLQNVLDQGYSIQKKLPKYGSIRYILRKDL